MLSAVEYAARLLLILNQVIKEKNSIKGIGFIACFNYQKMMI